MLKHVFKMINKFKEQVTNCQNQFCQSSRHYSYMKDCTLVAVRNHFSRSSEI